MRVEGKAAPPRASTRSGVEMETAGHRSTARAFMIDAAVPPSPVGHSRRRETRGPMKTKKAHNGIVGHSVNENPIESQVNALQFKCFH